MLHLGDDWHKSLVRVPWDAGICEEPHCCEGSPSGSNENLETLQERSQGWHLVRVEITAGEPSSFRACIDEICSTQHPFTGAPADTLSFGNDVEHTWWDDIRILTRAL